MDTNGFSFYIPEARSEREIVNLPISKDSLKHCAVEVMEDLPKEQTIIARSAAKSSYGLLESRTYSLGASKEGDIYYQVRLKNGNIRYVKISDLYYYDSFTRKNVNPDTSAKTIKEEDENVIKSHEIVLSDGSVVEYDPTTKIKRPTR